MKTQNNKNQSKAISRFYIDEAGKLIKKSSRVERLWMRLYFPFSALPPMVNILFAMLLFVEVCCWVGLCNQPKNHYKAEETATLLFLTVIIGFILAIGISAGQMMASQRRCAQNAYYTKLKNKDLHKKQPNQPKNHQSEL